MWRRLNIIACTAMAYFSLSSVCFQDVFMELLLSVLPSDCRPCQLSVTRPGDVWSEAQREAGGEKEDLSGSVSARSVRPQEADI